MPNTSPPIPFSLLIIQDKKIIFMIDKQDTDQGPAKWKKNLVL